MLSGPKEETQFSATPLHRNRHTFYLCKVNPFSAANFFASGLTNTLPFGPAGAAGRGLKVEGLQVGALEGTGAAF